MLTVFFLYTPCADAPGHDAAGDEKVAGLGELLRIKPVGQLENSHVSVALHEQVLLLLVSDIIRGLYKLTVGTYVGLEYVTGVFVGSGAIRSVGFPQHSDFCDPL